MHDWDDVSDAMKDGDQNDGGNDFEDAEKLPPGFHWVRIDRTHSYTDDDGVKVVILNFAEFGVATPREHAHFEKFVKKASRMRHVVKNLKALGAPEEVHYDAEKAYDWLGDSHNLCSRYKFRIEITETKPIGGKVYRNAKIVKDVKIGTDPGTTGDGGWKDWSGDKGGDGTTDDDVQF